MGTENINFDLSNLDMEKFIGKEANSLIIQNSPTIKINIEEDNAFYITGFNMMCMQDKLKYDLSDLNDSTMLIINQHHVSECILLIAGALRWVAIKTKNNIDINNSLHLITRHLSQQIIFYDDLKSMTKRVLENISIAYNINTDTDEMKNAADFMNKIWFLPYGEIDKIKEITAKELKGEIKNE